MKRILLLYLFLLILITSGCSNTEARKNKVEKAPYVSAQLFCDVDFWQAPQWDITPGTITGDISAATGLTLDFEVPSANAD
ncbi:MAG: hypothetical protein LBU77_05240, partial [Clostridiales bacterium]|nr:hypothetical protein [Clostridiales bacterium]